MSWQSLDCSTSQEWRNGWTKWTVTVIFLGLCISSASPQLQSAFLVGVNVEENSSGKHKMVAEHHVYHHEENEDVVLIVSSDHANKNDHRAVKELNSFNTSQGLEETMEMNCTPPAILTFPPDLFTQKERREGRFLIHLVASLYIFYAIAIVCDDYFVPSIEALCQGFRIPRNIAGATFMAVASSTPELFTNTISTFITMGDIGVGTIVGSALFNLLIVPTFCGFALGHQITLKLDWYTLARDSLAYLTAVILLILTLHDGKIYFSEALTCVIIYFMYIGVMWKNEFLRTTANRLVSWVKSKFTTLDEPPTDQKVCPSTICNEKDMTQEGSGDTDESSDQFLDEPTHILLSPPIGQGFLYWFEWITFWPVRLIFTLTIPDCRIHIFRHFCLLTLICCMIHIGFLTYLAAWFMTVIGHTLRIPDSVMGLTFIAAGNSLPEAVSSYVVARQGHGSMSISNAFGSNTFDILMCLGLPWLCLTIMRRNEVVDYIQINSGGLKYSTIFLFITIPLLYVGLAANKFYLDKKIAILTLVAYTLFIILAILIELNIFSMVNLPTCAIPGE